MDHATRLSLPTSLSCHPLSIDSRNGFNWREHCSILLTLQQYSEKRKLSVQAAAKQSSSVSYSSRWLLQVYLLKNFWNNSSFQYHWHGIRSEELQHNVSVLFSNHQRLSKGIQVRKELCQRLSTRNATRCTPRVGGLNLFQSFDTQIIAEGRCTPPMGCKTTQSSGGSWKKISCHCGP